VRLGRGIESHPKVLRHGRGLQPLEPIDASEEGDRDAVPTGRLEERPDDLRDLGIWAIRGVSAWFIYSQCG
jgi:hypothetical protein